MVDYKTTYFICWLPHMSNLWFNICVYHKQINCHCIIHYIYHCIAVLRSSSLQWLWGDCILCVCYREIAWMWTIALGTYGRTQMVLETTRTTLEDSSIGSSRLSLTRQIKPPINFAMVRFMVMVPNSFPVSNIKIYSTDTNPTSTLTHYTCHTHTHTVYAIIFKVLFSPYPCWNMTSCASSSFYLYSYFLRFAQYYHTTLAYCEEWVCVTGKMCKCMLM